MPFAVTRGLLLKRVDAVSQFSGILHGKCQLYFAVFEQRIDAMRARSSAYIGAPKYTLPIFTPSPDRSIVTSSSLTNMQAVEQRGQDGSLFHSYLD